VLGVLPGSMLGARVLVAAKTKMLRVISTGVILVMAVEMIWNGLTGRI